MHVCCKYIAILIISIGFLLVACSQSGNVSGKSEVLTISGTNFDSLAEDLHSPDYRVRKDAARKLGAFNDISAVNLLISALSDNETDVVDRASESLVNIGSSAVEPLVLALDNSDSKVRCRSADVLGGIGDKRAVAPLIVALQDRDSTVRGWVIHALGDINDVRSEEALVDVTRMDNWIYNRTAAARILMDMNGSATKSLLAEFQKGDINTIAKYFSLYMQTGMSGKESICIQVLEEYGNKNIAEDCINSGNNAVEQAGRDWADKHGYYVWP